MNSTGDRFIDRSGVATPIKGLACVASLLGSACAFAVDVIPGQGVAPPPGISSLMVSLGSSIQGDKYLHGQALGLNTQLEVDSLAIRYTRSFQLGESPAAVYIQPSLLQATPGGSLAAHGATYGLGDTALAFAHWLYTDTKQGRYLGYTAYLFLPTGDYDSNRLLNLSQNRYSGALQFALQSNLIGNLSGMLATDVQWFGKNDDYRLTHQSLAQKPLYSGQVTLMYKVAPSLTIAGSYVTHLGGEEKLNGVEQGNRIHRNRYQLSTIQDTSLGRFIAQYGEDISTENGFLENRQFWLRYQIGWK